MSGGGAPSPIQGGEFLLQLLRNPPQQPRQQQQPQSQNLSHDPAVAAVGPSIPFSQPLYQNNGHDHLPYRPPWSHSTPHFAPHNFFLQNPNPNLISSASPPRPGFDQSLVQNHQFVPNSNLLGPDDAVNLGNFGQNPKSISAHKQVQNDLMFGSLPFNGNHLQSVSSDREVGFGNRIQNGSGIEFRKNLELNRSKGPNKHTFVDHSGNTRWGAAPVRRPPPGFSSNSRSFEENVSRGKSKTLELNEKERVVGRRGPGERRLSGQFDRRLSGQFDSPGVPAGSKLHSASASDISDIEESQMGLHSKVGGDHVKGDDDQIASEIESLVLEDESADKDDKKKQKVTRDKEYRSDKRGQWLLNQRMRISKRRIECRSDIYRFNTPFLAIYESLIPSEEEKAKQKQFMALLEKHVNKEWPGAQLYLYGSCANSFGFKKSDIDVCLAIEDTDVNKSDVLLKLANILESDNLQNVQALTRARVPIVKLMDPGTGISCDICVNNLLAVINTKLLRDYAHIDGRLRQLAFIVKHWAKSRGVNETYQGTLSSYAYVLMCINFLQLRNPPILPCLQEMERTYSVTVDNAECAYFDQVDRLSGFGSQNRESIAQLVWAFFNYWAYYHDYTNEVISVRTGSTLSKHVKDWTRRVGNDRHLICIEDPFEISHDLGRVVDKYSIRVLREEFERAAEIMQYDPDPCVKLFDPYVPS